MKIRDHISNGSTVTALTHTLTQTDITENFTTWLRYSCAAGNQYIIYNIYAEIRAGS